MAERLPPGMQSCRRHGVDCILFLRIINRSTLPAGIWQVYITSPVLLLSMIDAPACEKLNYTQCHY